MDSLRLHRLSEITKRLNDANIASGVEVVVAPPSLYILTMKDKLRNDVELAGQNTYIDDEGAYTGEISPWMLAEEKIPWVILGHSERRSIFQEADDHIAEKTVAALKNGLKVIFCVGEKLEEREADKTLEIVERQLDELRKAKVEWSNIVSASANAR